MKTQTVINDKSWSEIKQFYFSLFKKIDRVNKKKSVGDYQKPYEAAKIHKPKHESLSDFRKRIEEKKKAILKSINLK